jgi:hypothetical protein
LRGERLELKKKNEEKCRRLLIEHMSIVTIFLLVETASFSLCIGILLQALKVKRLRKIE